EELDPAKTWLKYLAGVTLVWGVMILAIWTISFAVFPKLWIPPVFVWRGVTANVIFCTLACLELKVREEQQKVLREKDKRLKEQEKRLRQKQQYERQLQEDIENLQTTLLSQERLAFVGKLAPFIQHKTLNLYDHFGLNISVQTIDFKQLESMIDEILEILEEENTFTENEIESYKTNLLNLTQEIKEKWNEQRTIIKRGAEILDRFLPIFRHEQEIYLQPKVLDLKLVLENSVRINKYDFKLNRKDFNVKLETEIDDKLPFILGISSELEFALINVIENAYYAVWEKATTSGKEYQPIVKIKAESSDYNKIKVTIMDNGIGLPQKAGQVFLPFYSTKQKFQKAGLGLTLTKDILIQHYQGNIFCETIDNWTCFLIEISSSTD
ncbi:MAG: ATP-binding protein, partial [Crocosphaera sp.]